MEVKHSGLIIQIDGSSVVVITEDCRYYKIKRKKDMLKGQKVEFANTDVINIRHEQRQRIVTVLRSNYKKYVAVAASIVLVMCTIVLFNTRFDFKKDIYAYIDVDINPSLEIGIDSQNTVREVIPLNDDAINLINGLKLKNVLLKDVLRTIVIKSKEYGFLDKNKKDMMLISTALNKQDTEGKNVNDLIDDICNNLEEFQAKNINVKVISVQPEVRKLAVKSNISMGRYVIYEEAKKSGLNLNIETAKVIPLDSILHSIELEGTEVNSIMENQDSKTSTPTKVLLTPTPSKDNSSLLTSANTPANIPTNTSTNMPGNTPTKTLENTPANIRTNTPVNTPANTSRTANPVESVLIQGLRGEYYDNPDFTDLKTMRVDHEINFVWNEESPHTLMEPETFSVRWTGKIVPEFSENYTFYTYADDGVRLWVNNVLLIDNWVKHSPKEFSGTIELNAGTKYDIKLEYFENKGNAQVKLFWSSESQEKEIIPSKYFSYPANVIQAEKALFSNCVVEAKYSNYTGSGYVNYDKGTGSYIEWVVDVDKSALYTLNFKYSNASTVNRPMEIMVNNHVAMNNMNFNSTGAWNSWNNSGLTVWLDSGKNIIRATATTDEGGSNVDYLELLTP